MTTVSLEQMLRQQATDGLQAQLDAAVTNGDTESARKISGKIAELAVMTAPKPATGYGDVEIKAELDKTAPWFGTDPKKTAKAMEFGKTLDPKKFATPTAFAEAVVKAVDAEFKPPVVEEPNEDDDTDLDDEDDEGKGEKKNGAAVMRKRTDGPGEGDGGARTTGAKRGPWTKLSDAPRETQAEIKRMADKHVPRGDANKDAREKYISRALEAHYAQHQRTKGQTK